MFRFSDEIRAVLLYDRIQITSPVPGLVKRMLDNCEMLDTVLIASRGHLVRH